MLKGKIVSSKKVIIFFVSVALLVGFSSVKDALFYKPAHFPEPIYNFKTNPLEHNTIQLGRALFYDPILSRNNTISCASCHSQYSSFTHTDHALSHGIEDRVGHRNSPVLLNLAWQKTFMLDGAVHHLDMQALAPISNPLEMDENIANVVLKLQRSNLYPSLFYKAFNDSIITGEHTLKAISQFLLTLVSANSKYDSVINKETTFTAQENNGYQLFKENCASCHQEPLFTNGGFENNGLQPDSFLNDKGRYAITQKEDDLLKFKVPTLRNIEYSYPYMHDGRFETLMQVLNHYTHKVHKSETLSEELAEPIKLSSNEKVDLIAFLLTLSDKNFLFDPKFSFPRDVLLNERRVNNQKASKP